MKIFLLVLILFVSSVAQAKEGDLTLVVRTVGWHSKNNGTSNNVNPGLALRYEFVDRWSVQAGVHRNSYEDRPVRINGVMQTPELWSGSLGVAYTFWRNPLYETSVGYIVANNFYNVNHSGIIMPNVKEFYVLSGCRKLIEADSRWRACVNGSTYKNPTTVGFANYVGLTFGYQLN